MDEATLAIWINKLICHHNIKAFYESPTWRALRAETLNDQHNECQICKGKGMAEAATMVHHLKYVRDYPELALTKNNLIALCSNCHYLIHHTIKYKKQLNAERW